MSVMAKININPFAQSEHYVQLSFSCSKAMANQAEPYFDDIALSFSIFETDEQTHTWQVEMVVDQQPDEADINRRLKLLADAAGETSPSYTSQTVEPEMWQHNLQDFPPLTIGRYYIHGSHIQPEQASPQIPICVDAGMAFGSGEHATTEGCLMLFDRYMDELSSKADGHQHVLDMGCGSAILAMAAAKRLRQAKVVAVDIDEVSVKVAKQNAKINGVGNQLKCYAGNGYELRQVWENAPYDLVFANILAKPLMKMAADLSCALKPEGVAILSGMLESQEQMVLGAHRQVGLKLSKRWRKDGWSALLLRKS